MDFLGFFYKRRRFFAFFTICLLLFAALSYCHLLSPKKLLTPPNRVLLASTKIRDIPIRLSAIGTVLPTYSVTIKTQVNGQLTEVLFREGQLVKKGMLLAKIDDRSYRAQLLESEGQSLRDQAQLSNALLDLKRYQTLWKQNAISKQTLTAQRALVTQLRGTVKLDEGLRQNAQVNLSYTQIISPIEGRIGLRLVDPGNIIQTTDPNGIAVINLLSPITVVFALPDDKIANVLKSRQLHHDLRVEAWDKTENKILASGKLLTLDNQIDPTTGTIKLKALFQNKQNELFPNQFVNVSLWVDTLHQVLTVPTAAIQHDTKGPFVYLAQKDHSVKVTPVVTGPSLDDTTVITQGLSPHQLVVIEGGDKLSDGAKIIFPHGQRMNTRS